MGNKNELTGRNIVVSDFEVAPYDPDEYEYNGDQKCHGQIIVNKHERTITFRYISGTKPIFNVVLAVMALNKNWFSVFNAEECEAKYENNKVNVQAFYCYSLTNGSMYSLMKSTLSITVGLKYDVTAITIFLSGLM